MIFGIGTDLCDAGRMEKSLTRQSFVNHVFSPQEQDQLNTLHGKGVKGRSIYMDKVCGKDFNWPQYKKLVKKLKPVDALHSEHRPAGVQL